MNSPKPRPCHLTAKDVARIKVMMQYEVKKPLMDEVRRLRKEIKELKAQVAAMNSEAIKNALEAAILERLRQTPVGIVDQFRQKDGRISEPPY